MTARSCCQPALLIFTRWPFVRLTDPSLRPSRKISWTRSTFTMTERWMRTNLSGSRVSASCLHRLPQHQALRSDVQATVVVSASIHSISSTLTKESFLPPGTSSRLGYSSFTLPAFSSTKFLDAERNSDLSPEAAIYQGCLQRFRAIMMTTLAALLGAVPVALGREVTGEARRPLGIAVMGGACCSRSRLPSKSRPSSTSTFTASREDARHMRPLNLHC